ncbi:MAG: hypothetical protein V5A91_07030, partial [Candidatus Accumulibacter necessarius]
NPVVLGLETWPTAMASGGDLTITTDGVISGLRGRADKAGHRESAARLSAAFLAQGILHRLELAHPRPVGTSAACR